MRVTRFDRGSLRSPQVLADGSLRVDAVITRSGVFEYRHPMNGGRTTHEYRPDKEVFNRATLDSFIGMAVTDDHPYEVGGLLDLSNRENYQKGFVLEVRQDGRDVVATLVITNPDLIAKMQSGTDQVSCGYTQDYIEKTGVAPTGERYDGVQTNILGNHVAIVPLARAGDSARVRMDAATMIAGAPARKEEVMNLEQALAALAVANVKIGELTARTDAAEKTAVAATKAKEEATTRLDAVTAERDAAKEAASKAEKARTDSEASMMDRARERIALEASASRFLRTDAADPKTAPDVKKNSNSEIKKLIAEKLTGKTMEGQSEAYISARYDAAVEAEGEAETAMGEVRRVVDATRNDANPDDASKARAEMIARNRNDKKGA